MVRLYRRILKTETIDMEARNNTYLLQEWQSKKVWRLKPRRVACLTTGDVAFKWADDHN